MVELFVSGCRSERAACVCSTGEDHIVSTLFITEPDPNWIIWINDNIPCCCVCFGSYAACYGERLQISLDELQKRVYNKDELEKWLKDVPEKSLV